MSKSEDIINIYSVLWSEADELSEHLPPGAHYIIMLLLNYCSETELYQCTSKPRRRERSIEERYNTIMYALYGIKKSKPAYIDYNRKIVPDGYLLDEILIAMHEEEKKKTYKVKKVLVEKFVDRIPFTGIRDNAIAVLRNKYALACKQYKTEKDWAAFKDQVYHQRKMQKIREEPQEFIEKLKGILSQEYQWQLAIDLIDQNCLSSQENS